MVWWKSPWWLWWWWCQLDGGHHDDDDDVSLFSDPKVAATAATCFGLHSHSYCPRPHPRSRPPKRLLVGINPTTFRRHQRRSGPGLVADVVGRGPRSAPMHGGRPLCPQHGACLRCPGRWLGWCPNATSTWWHHRCLVRTCSQLLTKPSSNDRWAVRTCLSTLVRSRSCCRHCW